MKFRIAAAISLIGLLAQPVLAASEPQFKSAYIHQHLQDPGLGRKVVEFREIFEIDWETAARKHSGLALDNLTNVLTKQLAEDQSYGFTERTYRAPLTDPYRSEAFLFLSENGAREIRARELLGNVWYHFNTQGTRVTRIDYLGSILGTVDSDVAAVGGFVVRLADELQLFSTEHVAEPVSRFDTVNPYPTLKILKQIRYRFKNSAPSYLLVRFEPDKEVEYGGCRYIHHLFRENSETGELTDIAFTNFGCDV